MLNADHDLQIALYYIALPDCYIASKMPDSLGCSQKIDSGCLADAAARILAL